MRTAAGVIAVTVAYFILTMTLALGGLVPYLTEQHACVSTLSGSLLV